MSQLQKLYGAYILLVSSIALLLCSCSYYIYLINNQYTIMRMTTLKQLSNELWNDQPLCLHFLISIGEYYIQSIAWMLANVIYDYKHTAITNHYHNHHHPVDKIQMHANIAIMKSPSTMLGKLISCHIIGHAVKEDVVQLVECRLCHHEILNVLLYVCCYIRSQVP